jgi:hypothetical protein
VRIDLVGTTADFRGFGPPPSLPINHLLCKNRRTASRIGEDGLVPSILLAGTNEIPRLTFAQLVDSIRANSELTQSIKSYSGKEVEIRGFIIPAGPPDLSFFLLSRVSALGNYCCEMPVGQDETVYVFAAKEVKITYDPLRIFKIVGVFEAGMRADAAYGPSLFRVRDATVEEALGAKIFKTEEVASRASKP